jgi:hypothetical protein
MRRQGDQSEGTIYALALALEAQVQCAWNVKGDITGPGNREADLLRPLALSVAGSRRIKLEYANLLAQTLGLAQEPQQGVVTCEEALRVLEGVGLSDLSAASAWADAADSEARIAIHLGRLDDAERLEKQVQPLAERVLSRRPADLEARRDLIWGPDGMALIEACRSHDAAALQFARTSQSAAQDYLRFNPSDRTWGRMGLVEADCFISTMLFRQGHVAEALQRARAAMETDTDLGDANNSAWEMAELRLDTARWEAQRGSRHAANQAILEAKAFYDTISTRQGMSEINQVWAAEVEDAERQISLAFGEDAAAYTKSTNTLPALDRIGKGLPITDTDARAVLLHLSRQYLEETAQAALNLKRYTEAEAAARAMGSRQTEIGRESEHAQLDQPDDSAWWQVLLAQAQVGQDRKEEALKTLEPAIAQYRQRQAQGASHVPFRQHFARALYVQALAGSQDASRLALRRDELNEAEQLSQGLTDEAKQLHDSKELFSWIAAAQKNLDQEAEKP